MSVAKNKKNGEKNHKRSASDSDQYIMISKRHIYYAITTLILSIFAYQVYLKSPQILEFLSQKYQPISPHKEYVDTTKESPEFIQHYLEPETHPNPQVRNLPSDFSTWPPGEMGIGVSLIDSAMSKKEKVKRKTMYENHAFEEYVSELIALNRSLPDFRGQWCRDQYDGKIDTLEKVSIIICFHNEAWSTLMRSVHSIINRSS